MAVNSGRLGCKQIEINKDKMYTKNAMKKITTTKTAQLVCNIIETGLYYSTAI